jgi:hypothetical protein
MWSAQSVFIESPRALPWYALCVEGETLAARHGGDVALTVVV